ncbi:hypothetical protein BJ684DRAFT_11830 [Piptocephalis cylindrospora]|uniref:Protein transport protein BOS1 n=1 Tax=Piptocephalis cylindrospora TaxID=1907219 RepID=A0A4P9Y0C9_9FUNG|nr:hypothetical protein BJ684DRAFT_11830 [Piptocephalis cylindrospora]|eukprot:RKP12213.1 hypothetical protein BJ684DRAFT_11830 [Piptocephalis cylindrospora]
MNSVYNQAVKQMSFLRQSVDGVDMGTVPMEEGEARASEASERLGEIIKEYESLAKREIIATKQKMAEARVEKLRNGRAEQLERLRRAKDRQGQRAHQAEERNQLFQAPQTYGEGGESTVISMGEVDHQARERAFADATESQLDDFLAQGRAALNNLVEQRSMLKGAQRRVLDAANTLGLSRNVIQYIERRSTQDKYIFFAGLFTCIFLMWATIHYLT